MCYVGYVNSNKLLISYLSQEGLLNPKKARGNKKADVELPGRKNTAIYITNLPLDVTETEINDVFSKCGVIAEEIDHGKPRIKLYKNEDGKTKGDALVVYFRPESVKLAVQMLDDSDFRSGVEGTRIKVQPADFSYKAQQEAPVKKSAKEKRKVIAKTQKLNRLLLPSLSLVALRWSN